VSVFKIGIADSGVVNKHRSHHTYLNSRQNSGRLSVYINYNFEEEVILKNMAFFQIRLADSANGMAYIMRISMSRKFRVNTFLIETEILRLLLLVL